MSEITTLIRQFNRPAEVTDEEYENTLTLLHMYTPVMLRSSDTIEEMNDDCLMRRRQLIEDYVNLAVDYDMEYDRKRIAARLSDMGHCM